MEVGFYSSFGFFFCVKGWIFVFIFYLFIL